VSTDQTPLGSAVIVNGKLVAWFADFDAEAEDFCSGMWFGQWVTWRAEPPKLVPLTEEEHARVQAEAAALMANIRIR
jgi:hypothetical protein